jgi:poly-gamma-glutamate synthase PgsB/CapB
VFTLSLLLAALLLLGVLEKRLHQRALHSIPVRIHVNGTRGKSTTTRLIAGALRAAGFRVIAKTTGTAPRLILEDGSEQPIKRRGPVTILEQRRVVRWAAKRRAEVLVSECMGVNPEVQWTLEHHLIQSTIGVITNIRADHLDEMGSNLESIARCLALTIPRSGHLVTSEERFFSLLRDLAQQEGSSIFYADPQSVSPEELASFPHRAFAANVACALEVCRVLGVDRETALKGMRDITPDPGVLKFWKVSRGGQDFFFVNAMAANDLASTLEAWQDPLVQALAASSFMVVLFNNRGDRPFRIGEMAQFIKGQSGIDRVCICGEQKRLVKRRIKLAGIDLTKVEATSSRLTGDRLLNQLGSFTSRPVSIFACGNIKGDGWTIMDYFERNGEELEDADFASSCHRNGNQLSLH